MPYLTAGLSLMLALLLTGCAGARPAVPAAPGETGAASVAEITGNLARTGFLDSADGFLRISGKAGLTFSLKRLSTPPRAPAGWEFAGPVFDITALDGQRRPVQQLAQALSLRFNVRGHDRPLTVMAYRDGAWQIIESEVDADGRLVAEVDHLTPYAVAGPAPKTPGGVQGASSAKTQPAGAAAARPPLAVTPAAGRASVATPATRPATAAAPGAMRTAVGTPGAAQTRAATPGAVRTAVATPAAQWTAVATTSVSPIASADAQKVLAAAAAALKGKSVKVSSAMGYTGSLSMAIPDKLQERLGAALSANGTGYYGMYSGINQVIVAQAAGDSAVGSLTLLVEPKTTLPTGADDAKAQLARLFPGVGGDLTQAEAATNGYTFYRVSGATAYSVGYVQYESLVLAYAMAGSGSYQALAVER